MKVLIVDTFPENPTNPARTDLQTGLIELNRSSFELLPEYTKKFVLYHEVGHYLLKTYDECKADDYALRRLAGKFPYSLKHHIDSVYLLARDDVRRKMHALKSVLTIEANCGNQEAIELLEKYK